MFNKDTINRLIRIIERNNGIGDKGTLASIVQKEFSLTLDRKVYYCDDFAIRYSKSQHKRMSNTVLSLSALQKYDDRPFFVCIVASNTNYLLLANSTFLKKISHSSQELRVDNIKGSFNGSDIMMDFDGIENEPSNFEDLYAYHSGLSFQDNLERLVEATNGIVGRVQQFNVTDINKRFIIDSVSRAQDFIQSEYYNDLKEDLDGRVKKVQGEIAIAAFIDNVNLRGRIIEYLITDDGTTLKRQIISALRNQQPLPQFKTEDKLGDYSKNYPNFQTETDIKTKVLFLDGNPKAYNVDKLLEFLATEKSVYMIYLLGIDENGKIVARMCSVFDKRLIPATNIIHHWAGRNSRGVAQFIGHALTNILDEENYSEIDAEQAKGFINRLINNLDLKVFKYTFHTTDELKVAEDISDYN